MPVRELMTWIAGQKRWTIRYRRQRYYVSARQLGIEPQSKEASREAANEWWTQKRAEIDLAYRASLPVPRAALPMEDIAAAMLGSAADWPTALADLFRRLASALPSFGHVPAETPQVVNEETAAAVLRQAIQGLLGKVVIDGEALPDEMSKQLPPARVNQIADAVKSIRGEQAAPAERTVAAHAAAWISAQEKQAAAGQLTIARVNNVRMALAHFTRWLGESADVGDIDAPKVQGFYEHCLTQVAARRTDGKSGWSVPFAKEVFAVARAWIRWLTEQGTIDPPRNLASTFRFGSTAKEIPTWSVDEVRRVIGEAPGKLRLCLLLMCNAGMNQIDVSELQDSEVDWQHGTITRKRSKAKNYANAPTVTYRLWPLTRELLQKYRSGTKRVLLTESGLPYVRNEKVNGKLRKADGFTSNFAHLKRRLRFKKSMKLLRKTGATSLDKFDPSGRVSTLYLGHSPRSMKDRHYSRPDQEHFDRAIAWLGQQFGFVDQAGP